MSSNFNVLSWLSKDRLEKRQFAVIGLGRFGRSVCNTLHKMGYEVLGADIEEKNVAEVMTEKIVSHAMQLDSREVSALQESGILELDTVVVAIGSFLEESIVTTLNVKEGGVRYVVAKASSDIHGKLLKRVGADRVVYPEWEAGHLLATKLTKPAIVERFDLDSDHSIVEILVPPEFSGKTLEELQLRRNYGLNVLAVGTPGNFDINPRPSVRLQQGLMMVVLGNNQEIHKLPLSHSLQVLQQISEDPEKIDRPL
jgi:trk system potassium uptake protein